MPERLFQTVFFAAENTVWNTVSRAGSHHLTAPDAFILPLFASIDPGR